jgi:conjugal transfer pilus assembly protein TraW
MSRAALAIAVRSLMGQALGALLVAAGLALLMGMVVVVAVVVIALPSDAQAKDLGTVGPVYEITEPDMLLEIQAKLRAKEASGELGRINDEAQRRIRAAIETPAPVKGLRTAQVDRSYLFDPSVRFEESVLNDKGRVVIPAGTNANPLSVVSLPAKLLFFDGRDPAQVVRVQAELLATRTPVTPILVGGSPLMLANAWKRPVYFDQDGRMVRRFGIAAVPARVTQQGQVLLIQEFVAK